MRRSKHSRPPKGYENEAVALLFEIVLGVIGLLLWSYFRSLMLAFQVLLNLPLALTWILAREYQHRHPRRLHRRAQRDHDDLPLPPSHGARGRGLLSDKILPDGDYVPLILQIKVTPDARTVIERMTLHLHD